MKQLVLQIKRGSRGYGLSLIYRGLDKYPEEDTGIFVAKCVAGGQAERCGLQEDDKIISINNQTPRNVEDAVEIIKNGGKVLVVAIVRNDGMNISKDPMPNHQARTVPIQTYFSDEQNLRVSQRPPTTQQGREQPSRGQSYPNREEKINRQPRMTQQEQVMRTFDNLTSHVDKFHIKDGYLSPGASSVKSSKSLHNLGLDNYPYPEMPEEKKLTRKGEKQSLQNLNNRLAGYIDKVRRLQQDNSRLTKEIRKREEYQSHEVSNVKHVYDQEIESLKNALDGLSKQYNQLKVASEGLLTENEDMKENLRRKETDLRDSQHLINDLRKELEDLSKALRTMEIDKRVAENKMNEVYPEVLNLKKKLDETKKILDEELFSKANLEDQCKRMEEESKFKMQVLENQLEEVRSRKEVEITQIDDKLQTEYEDKLQKALNDLREVYENQMEENKVDLSNLYDSRVNDLQSDLANERGRAALSSKTLEESKSRIETLVMRISDLENANLSLNQKISDMAQNIEDDRSSHRAQIGAKDGEIQRLLDELQRQVEQYQSLMDTKIALDMEIAVYRRLLESEEDRLGIAMDGGDGLVTRVIPPTPATTRTQHPTSGWRSGRAYTQL